MATSEKEKIISQKIFLGDKFQRDRLALNSGKRRVASSGPASIVFPAAVVLGVVSGVAVFGSAVGPRALGVGLGGAGSTPGPRPEYA